MAAPALPLSEFPILAPPPRRYQGPIIDAHMHARSLASMQAYWDVAEGIYGVGHAVPIVDLATAKELKAAYGGRVQPAVWGFYPRKESLGSWPEFQRDRTAHLEQIAEAGFRIVKLWFTPRFLEWSNLRLDDPRLDFFFDRVRALQLAILIHVADPDCWFAKRIHDLEEHGAKPEHYRQLTTRLEQYPEVIFQLAHFAGHPEDPEHLASLLERYPNVYLDSSATKWISREFGRLGQAGRDFLLRWQDRVLFGSDLVADPDREKEGRREHYASRFYVHQLLWEESGRFDSPIEDEDSESPPAFQGFHLPSEVLARFYWGNAARLYGFQEKGGGFRPMRNRTEISKN